MATGSAVPFQEDAPLGIPLSPYGVTKRAAELLALHYHRVHGVPAVCLRPFSVYGPRIRPDLAMHVFATAITRGEPIPLFGDGTYQRDFTHVSDICAGLSSALAAEDAVGEAINLGHHQPVAVNELVTLLERELGRKAIVDRRPAFAGDMPLTCADLGKARRLLGYAPRVSLADGVHDFVAWFRAKLARQFTRTKPICLVPPLGVTSRPSARPRTARSTRPRFHIPAGSSATGRA